MKIIKFLAVMLILAAGVLPAAACQEIASPLEDFNWVLTQYGPPGNSKTPLPDTQITAFFDSREKTVTGSGGCNSYGAAYTVDRLTLKITGPVTMTEMSCGGEKDIQENEYINLLKNADRFELEQGRLIIFSGQSRLYFKNEGSTVKPPTHWGG